MDNYPPLNLLLVDDVAVHRMLMRDGLARINPFINCSEAGNIADAREILLSNMHFNAVICDRAMPGGEGTELAKWMRTMHCFDRTAFIMISGMIEPEDIIHAFMEAQVDGYVTKPFTHTDLHEKLMACICKRNGLSKRA